ncbi:hypothetical protein CKO31_10765 [Thiohalocapsa halophila]|uniref:Protein kinase domain-containing protein n=1 Tax=Thiohalocapsa halophila TaxID=69359 RepID=A0ABS1CIL9_9GAMM|nr:hypothetical protein [Thiohalocapsa halophila]MBK1631211.1 hypothetical protein [Thiohalocapsa halophila]
MNEHPLSEFLAALIDTAAAIDAATERLNDYLAEADPATLRAALEGENTQRAALAAVVRLDAASPRDDAEFLHRLVRWCVLSQPEDRPSMAALYERLCVEPALRELAARESTAGGDGGDAGKFVRDRLATLLRPRLSAEART